MALRRLSGFKMTEEKILEGIPHLHDMVHFLEARDGKKKRSTKK